MRDLTASTRLRQSVRRLIKVIDRRIRLSLSEWRGHGVGFLSGHINRLSFQRNVCLMSKKVLRVREDGRGVPAGEVLTPAPLGEGWGEVLY